MTEISAGRVFPNFTCFSLYGIARSGSADVNKRLSLFSLQSSQHHRCWGPFPTPGPGEALQRGTAARSLPCAQRGAPGAVCGVLGSVLCTSVWTWWCGDTGSGSRWWWAGWDRWERQGGRAAVGGRLLLLCQTGHGARSCVRSHAGLRSLSPLALV